MTPRRIAPSWHGPLGQAFAPSTPGLPGGVGSGAAPPGDGDSDGTGTLLGELLKLLEDLGCGNASPPPVDPDLDAHRIRRCDLRERERAGLRDRRPDSGLLGLRQ